MAELSGRSIIIGHREEGCKPTKAKGIQEITTINPAEHSNRGCVSKLRGTKRRAESDGLAHLSEGEIW